MARINHCSVIQQDYTELLEENHYFYKKFVTDEVINKVEIQPGGETEMILSS